MTLRTALLASGFCLATLVFSLPAAANGCNGVVNQLVWGCAAWDNNNGPQYPNYHAAARPTAAPVPQPSLAPRTSPILSSAGGGFIGNNGSALVGNASGTLRDRNGNVISTDGAGMRH